MINKKLSFGIMEVMVSILLLSLILNFILIIIDKNNKLIKKYNNMSYLENIIVSKNYKNYGNYYEILKDNYIITNVNSIKYFKSKEYKYEKINLKDLNIRLLEKYKFNNGHVLYKIEF